MINEVVSIVMTMINERPQAPVDWKTMTLLWRSRRILLTSMENRAVWLVVPVAVNILCVLLQLCTILRQHLVVGYLVPIIIPGLLDSFFVKLVWMSVTSREVGSSYAVVPVIVCPRLITVLLVAKLQMVRVRFKFQN